MHSEDKKVITFSGIDCAGKSTQIEIIKEALDSHNIKNRVIWSRGGYTSWVEGIKTLVRRDKGFSDEEKKKYREDISNNSKKSKLLLWASIMDLVRYYGIVFRCIELTGTKILCDRYLWDTYIDFKMKYPTIDFSNWKSWKLLERIAKKPECSIVFTIPIEESMKRSVEKNDQHSEPYDFRLQRINQYIMAINENKWQYVVDAMKSKELVTAEVKEIIRHNAKGINF